MHQRKKAWTETVPTSSLSRERKMNNYCPKRESNEHSRWSKKYEWLLKLRHYYLSILNFLLLPITLGHLFIDNLYKYHSAQRVCSSKWPILGMVPIDLLSLVSPAPRGWDFLVSDIPCASGYSGISHELAKGLRMDVKVHLTAGTIVEKAPLELNISATLWHSIGE